MTLDEVMTDRPAVTFAEADRELIKHGVRNEGEYDDALSYSKISSADTPNRDSLFDSAMLLEWLGY